MNFTTFAAMNKESDTPQLPGKNNRRAKWWLIGAAVVITVFIIVAWPYFFTHSRSEQVIYITGSSTRASLTDSLSRHFDADFADRVMTLLPGDDSRISSRAGRYVIPAGTSPFTAARKLSRGQDPVKIVINGFRIPKVMTGKIAAKMSFSQAQLDSLLADSTYMARYGLTPAQSMALFTDNTYETFWSDSPEKFVDRIGKVYQSIWNPERTAKAKKLGLTPAEVMIVASITDEESNKSDEKGAIGRLYINRIAKGMKLQADPTVKYAIGDFSIRRITGAMLSTDSPYNTYRAEGLPPGPIRTTSTATIDSILNSKPHDYLYICAKSDFSGYHAFATTYEEHQKNAREYQQELDRRNIK